MTLDDRGDHDILDSFYDDLVNDLRDQEFRDEYIRQTMRIQEIDRIVNSDD